MTQNNVCNLLLIDIGGDQHTNEIPNRLRETLRPSTVGAITSTKSGFQNQFDFFVNYDDIISEKCLGDNSGGGIGTNIYKLVKNCEVDALRMMDRLPRFQHGYTGTFSERRELFFQLSKFLYKFITENQVTHVIFSNIPHEVYDFILYSICKSLSIPTLIFNDAGGVIKHSLTICESIEELGLLNFGSKIKSAIESINTENWNTDVEVSFKRQNIITAASLRKSNISLSGILKNAPVTKRRYRLYSSKREYRKQTVSRSLPTNYVLLALHVQPELSTSPSGGHFVEQIEAIRFLASHSAGYTILVREHPDQFRLRIPRPKGFYEAISNITGVKISPNSINVREIVSKSAAVATVSGTIALESVLLGKPGFILGYSWFRECPGVYNISNESAINKAFGALKDWSPPSETVLNEYLEDLKSSLFQGTTWGSPIAFSTLETSELRHVTVTNVTNIINYWVSTR
jgi:hypothetical protein